MQAGEWAVYCGMVRMPGFQQNSYGKGRGVVAVKGVIQDKTQTSFRAFMARMTMPVYPY